MDTSKYIIEDIQNTEVGRIPGEINGMFWQWCTQVKLIHVYQVYEILLFNFRIYM